MKDNIENYYGDSINSGEIEKLFPLLNTAIDYLKDTIIITEADVMGENGPKIIFANQAVFKLTGYRPAEIIGKTPRIFQGELTDRATLDRIRQALLAQTHIHEEVINYSKAGQSYWVELYISPVKNEQGLCTHFIAIERDITGRKLAEEVIFQQASLLDQVYNSVIAADQTGKIISLNHHAEILYQWSKEEALGQSIVDLIVPASSRNMLHEILAELKVQSVWSGEFEAKRKDGSLFFSYVTLSNLKDSQGKYKGTVGVSYDISERRQTKELVNRMAAFPKYNPNPVYQFDKNGTLEYFNEAATKLAHELGKKHPGELLPTGCEQIVKDCLEIGMDRNGLLSRVNNHSIAWSFYPIENLEVVHVYSKDLTEQLIIEEQLRQAQKMDSIGQLAGGVAHDFNNILTAIIASAELLGIKTNNDPQTKNLIDQIMVSAERATALTQQLLAFSRRQVIQTRALNLNNITENVLDMLQRVIGERINLNFQPSAALPQILGDENMLQQVLLNLVVNARDAMPDGGEITITTAVTTIDLEIIRLNADAQPGEFVCLKVTDSGCGIDPTILPNIFDPFFTTKEVGKGTGLGLSTVYGIVKQLNGWIWVDSELGKGTTFSVYLPKEVRMMDLPISPITKTITHGNNEVILLVEDDNRVLELAKLVLVEYGYQVITASTAMEAVMVWETNKAEINLLFSDVVMPGKISGLELAELLTQEKPDLKVILTSGYNIEMLDKGYQAENFKFLPKPYTPMDLTKIVSQVLGSPRKQS